MGLSTASGSPSFSGTYIPELWSNKYNAKYYAKTEYEGEIKNHGDTLHIVDIPTATIRNYVKGAGLITDEVTPTDVELLIDKGKYFNFPAYMVDKHQSHLSYVNKWAEGYSKDMRIAIEQDVFGNIYADAHASNKGASAGAISGNLNMGASGSPRSITENNVIEVILDCGQVLDEQNAPDDGRWFVAPAWFCQLIKNSDLKDASLAGDDKSILRGMGAVGMIDRFMIYNNNNLTTTADGGGETATNIIFGHKAGFAFATQLNVSERIKNQNDFGDLVRALQVYGYKVTYPPSLGHLYCYKG
jgi:hypothetical protein